MSKTVQVQKSRQAPRISQEAAPKFLHSPTLNTVIMVEDAIKDWYNSEISVPQLKKVLPKQVNHNTLMSILEYLEASNKIAIGLRGIVWIQNDSPILRKALRESTEM
ncbi:MAG: hypothetical protein WCX64_06900 [Candidatus Micrarchaeia archaeon]